MKSLIELHKEYNEQPFQVDGQILSLKHMKERTGETRRVTD